MYISYYSYWALTIETSTLKFSIKEVPKLMGVIVKNPEIIISTTHAYNIIIGSKWIT